MSVWGVNVSLKIIAVAVVVVVAGALLPALTTAPSREITLVAKGMAFRLADDPQQAPNPTLEVRAGEHVRIVLRNQDPGFTHDFAIPALDAGLEAINWNQTGDVVLSVPDVPGTYEYVCRPHALMMRGTIRVVAE